MLDMNPAGQYGSEPELTPTQSSFNEDLLIKKTPCVGQAGSKPA